MLKKLFFKIWEILGNILKHPTIEKLLVTITDKLLPVQNREKYVDGTIAEKLLVIIIDRLLAFPSREKHVDGTRAYGFLGIVSDDYKAEYAADLIVKAFDTKDKKLLKSILHDYVIENYDELDSEIDKAFSFYQGHSITYKAYLHGSRSISERKIYAESTPGINIETDKGKYLIRFVYNTRNEYNPNDVGIYNIDIFHEGFFQAYYGPTQNDNFEELRNEISEVTKIKWLKPEEEYNRKDPRRWGIGVFAGDETTMRQLYYEKNGKEMVLYAVDKESGELLKDENGNLIEVPEGKSVYLEDLPDLE